MKLNLGATRLWKREGWTTLDHNILQPFHLPHQAWDLPWKDETFEAVFASHILEHISHFWAERTLCEINRVMKPGAVLRILTPDLEVLCRAYVNRDTKALKLFIREDNHGCGNGIRDELGPAQALLGFLYSPGHDNYLINSSCSRFLGGYAHLFCYDFELLSGLLLNYGFCSVERKSIDDSAIEEHRELRNYAYDNDKNHSLVVECIKDDYVPFDCERMLLLNGPYPYNQVVECKTMYLEATKVGLAFTSRMRNLARWLGATARRMLGRLGRPRRNS